MSVLDLVGPLYGDNTGALLHQLLCRWLHVRQHQAHHLLGMQSLDALPEVLQTSWKIAIAPSRLITEEGQEG